MKVKTLLIDVGNSRVKWAVLDKSHLCSGKAFSYKEQQIEPLFDAYWKPLSGITDVIVSNVGGLEIAEHIEGWCSKQWKANSHFVRPKSHAYGVTNSYQNPQQLGVDRWVCLVAAREMGERATCIIDCGTAVTIDALNGEGKHLGGMIAPGIQLMKRALLNNTSDISEAGDNPECFLGQCTADAVQNGAIHSVAGLIERAARELNKQYKEDFLLVLTGGDAEQIQKQLNCDVRLVADLALRGLVVITRDQSK